MYIVHTCDKYNLLNSIKLFKAQHLKSLTIEKLEDAYYNQFIKKWVKISSVLYKNFKALVHSSFYIYNKF